MSRRNGRGNNAARDAPFGTDAQPTTKVRIVGGRQVDIPVDSPPTSAGSRSSQKSLPPIGSGSHGTPPIETQPTAYEDDDDVGRDQPPGFSSYVQKENARNLHPRTSPGDKSNSHIHSNRGFTELPGSHKVLPPISRQSPLQSSHSPVNNNMSGSFSPPMQLNKPEISFTDQLKDALEDYDPYRFQDMYKELAGYDHKLCGFVSEAQANMVALRHELPLNTNMLKLLFSNFSKDDHPDLVNYEKMIQYLARAQLGTAEAETVLQESVNRFVNAPPLAHSNSSSEQFDQQQHALSQQIEQQEAARHHQQQAETSQRQHQREEDRYSGQPASTGSRQPAPTGFGGSQGNSQSNRNDRRQSVERQDTQKQDTGSDVVPTRKPLRSFSDREDAKLLALVEQQYIQGGEEPTDLMAMRNQFTKKDRFKDGTLTKKEIQDVCFNMRIPVQGSIMEKLMQRCDTGDGQYSWTAFLDFLERVTPLSTGTKHTPEPPRAQTWPTNNREESNKPPKNRERHQPQEPGPPPWETRKPLARLDQKPPSEVEREITRYDQSEDYPSHQSSASVGNHRNSVTERSQLEALAKDHRARAIEANQVKQMHQAQAVEEAGERWFERYMHLANGLYSADSTNTGYLSKDEMHRILKNYNLIYQLGFSESKIDRVINTHTAHRGLISIEHLLESLRQQVD